MTAITHAPSLPEWLAPSEPRAEQRSIVDLAREMRDARLAQKQLDEIVFESLFDEFLDRVRENGLGVGQLFTNDPREPDYKRFVAWVMRDDRRRTLYYEAKEIGAEVLELEIPMIADASDTLEDVNRSTLRVNSRKWLLGVWNRKRFGETRQIEQNVTIDLSGAMQQAQERLDRARTVDGVTRRIE